MHVALRVAYDGTRFQGLARQPDGNTIEDALLVALRQEGYVEGTLRCGSRTDAGVSATMNVLATQLDRPHLRGLVPALAKHLPDGLWVTGVAEVSPDWNVRHAASRTYHYLARRQQEDADVLEAACRAFEGTHDFRAFARIEDRNPERPVQRFDVTALDDMWRFEVQAPGFLWNQVRRMVDAALAVGQGRASPADIRQSLASGQPHGAFAVAPAAGLYLHHVAYDPEPAWQGALSDGRAWKARQAAAVRNVVASSLSESS